MKPQARFLDGIIQLIISWYTDNHELVHLSLAIASIGRMMSSIDFKPQTLLYAAREADQRGLKVLLNYILQELLQMISGDNMANTAVKGLDASILLRLVSSVW